MTLAEHFGTAFDRKLPTALIAALALQSIGAVFWAGSAAERITVLEKTTTNNQAAIERVAVLEEQITTIRQQLDRIETKLDRTQPR